MRDAGWEKKWKNPPMEVDELGETATTRLYWTADIHRQKLSYQTRKKMQEYLESFSGVHQEWRLPVFVWINDQEVELINIRVEITNQLSHQDLVKMILGDVPRFQDIQDIIGDDQDA